MSNLGDVTGGTPIIVLSQSFSGVNAINPLVAFYKSMEERGAILLFCPGHHTRHSLICSEEKQFKLLMGSESIRHLRKVPLPSTSR
jgi:hypothetical protein